MEKRLKKQRNRLFLRVILILLAVWLTVSAAFCAVRLIIEKGSVQSGELSKLSYINHLLAIESGDFEVADLEFLEETDFIYPEDGEGNRFNAQLVITDRNTNEVTVDTANCIGIRLSIKVNEEMSVDVVELLNYDTLRNALSDEEYQSIEKWLTTERDDGNYYELICTKFQIGKIYYIPLELKIVLANADDPRFLIDDDIETYDLSENYVEGIIVDESGLIKRNVIPKNLILNKDYNEDYISSLTKKQRKSSVEMIHLGATDYIFYASNSNNHYYSENNAVEDEWLVQYAKKVSLFDNCKFDLALGIALIFGFFLTIAVIINVMIWRTVKEQIIQEQKRLDLTNALAHDIKTPLFVISGYAYSLKENIDESERDEYLDKIIEQTDEVNDLVHRMLDFSKLDSYKMSLNKTEFDLSELARELMGDYVLLPEDKTLSFTRSGNNMILADRELVKTALKNLLDNAVKHSAPGSEIKIDVSGKAFSISNPSEPLTKEELKQLRQPYVRKEKSRSRKGNGLGLSIVTSIAELHGARFDMDMKDSILTARIKF